MTKLETQELSKAYRGRKVVDDVSVFVEQGEVVDDLVDWCVHARYIGARSAGVEGIVGP